MSEARKVLMACANYWNSPIQVGDQQLARKFAAAGWQVAYLSAPITPLHWLARTPDLRERFSIYKCGGQRDLDGRLFHYVPGAALSHRDSPLLRANWLLRHWPRLTMPNTRRVLAKNGFEQVDLLYLRDARQSYWLDALPHRAAIYRIADHDAAFHGVGEHLMAAEHVIAQAVDIVLYTAPNLREYAQKLAPRRLHYLPNGVDCDHFAKPAEKPPEFAKIAGPIAIYVGSIDFWFDFELLDAVAAALPEVNFVIIGPERSPTRKIAPRPNIHLLGPRPHASIPAYLHAANVGIIPFNVREHGAFVDAINPIKLHEYFACGLPCVTTDWRALRELNTPALLAPDANAFIAAIRQSIAAPPPRETLIDFARRNDWNARFAELLDLLTPLLAA